MSEENKKENVTEFPNKENPDPPLPQSPEETTMQFGKVSPAKKRLIDSILGAVKAGCRDNPILITEILEHVTGTWMQECLKGNMGLPPNVYCRLMAENASLRIQECTAMSDHELSLVLKKVEELQKAQEPEKEPQETPKDSA